MRATTEQNLNEIWYGDREAPAWLRGLVPVYRIGNRVDRWWKSRQRPEDLAGACIIVVGNITVGGSGKSPLVIRLCRMLRDAGFEPGVISRGYGSQQSGLRLVSPASDPSVVGDEPLMIAQQAGVPVIVSPDRCAAARALLKKGLRVIVSDDGLQHYRLPRSIEICVVDGSRGFGNGRLLPAGPLREPLDRLAAVDPRGPYAERTFAVLPTDNRGRRDRFLDLMRLQGVELYTVAEPFVADSATDQMGRRRSRVTVPAGSVLIPNRQPLARLVPLLLEPSSEDSLLHWGFFNSWIVQQWSNRLNPYPVLRVPRLPGGVQTRLYE